MTVLPEEIIATAKKRVQLGVLARKARKMDLATRQLSAAVEEFLGFPGASALLGTALFELGICFSDLKKPSEAIKQFEQCLKVPDISRPLRVSCLSNLGGLFLVTRDFGRAQEVCEEAIGLCGAGKPDRAAAMNLQVALRAQGRRLHAIQRVRSLAAAAASPDACGGVGGHNKDGGSEGQIGYPSSCSQIPTEEPSEYTDECEHRSKALEQEQLVETANAKKMSSVVTQKLKNTGSTNGKALAAPAAAAVEAVAVCCVKWGDRYSADYANILLSSIRRHCGVPSQRATKWICFTDDYKGLLPFVTPIALPDTPDCQGWWGKAWLFSRECTALFEELGVSRVVYVDLDSVVVRDVVTPLLGVPGDLAVLSTRDIFSELDLDGQGVNSSVMVWRPRSNVHIIWDDLVPSVRRLVHRFDYWLEMLMYGPWTPSTASHTAAPDDKLFKGAEAVDVRFVQDECPGLVRDFCQWKMDMSLKSENICCQAKPNRIEDIEVREEWHVEESVALVTFPRTPKPHELLQSVAFVRDHWRVCNA